MKKANDATVSDNGPDSEHSKHSEYLPLKTFASLFNEYLNLLQVLKTQKQKRDFVYSRSLITKQLSDECLRKLSEQDEEIKEKVGELEYKSNRKEGEIRRIQENIRELELEKQAVLEKHTLVLPLTLQSLEIHSEAEDIKKKFAETSRILLHTELQLEELERHHETLTGELTRCKLLNKVNKHQSLCQSYYIPALSESSESSVECIFPEKFQGNNAPKPLLPKLDFSRLGRVHRAPPKIPLNLMIVKDFEKKCQEQTTVLANKRVKVWKLEQHNVRLRNKLMGKKAMTERSRQKNRGRALSSKVDYVPRQSPECQSVVSHEAFSSVHSNTFICHDDLDSVLIDCINDIDD